VLMQVALSLNVPVKAVIPCHDYENNYLGDERNEYWRLYHKALPVPVEHLFSLTEISTYVYFNRSVFIPGRSSIRSHRGWQQKA
jgi:hypothetical protein